MFKNHKDHKAAHNLLKYEMPPWIREFTNILHTLNINHNLLFNKQLAELDMTIGIRAILYLLMKNGGRMMQKDFTSEIPVTKQAITRTLNMMIEKKYIKRMTSNHDRRKAQIKITKKGINKLEKSVLLSKDVNKKIQNCLGEERCKEVTEYLKNLNTLYEEEISLLNKK